MYILVVYPTAEGWAIEVVVYYMDCQKEEESGINGLTNLAM